MTVLEGRGVPRNLSLEKGQQDFVQLLKERQQKVYELVREETESQRHKRGGQS